MTTKDELESLFDEASDYLRLKTGVGVSWMFTDWQNHKHDTVIDKIKVDQRYVKFTFYNVLDIMSTEQRPKIFTTSSKRLLRKLFAYFEQGTACLEITRTGEGTDTDYEIYPITSREERKE